MRPIAKTSLVALCTCFLFKPLLAAEQKEGREASAKQSQERSSTEKPRSPAAPEENDPALRPGGSTQAKATLPPEGKGRYVGVNPQRKVEAGKPVKSIRHDTASHLESRDSQRNYAKAADRVKHAQGEKGELKKPVTTLNESYQKNLLPQYQKLSHYGAYHGTPAYAHYYSAYQSHGFYGGYAYPVRPFLNLGSYLYYPITYWLFNSGSANGYYQSYYGKDVSTFDYAGVFYPTDALRDLSVDVSGMEDSSQANFREDLGLLVKKLTERIGKMMDSKLELGRGEVVLNHYENLKNEAIVVEGFVDKNDANIHVPFKALLDLEKPSDDRVFVPSQGAKEDDLKTVQQPTQEDLKHLDALNDQITRLGGDPTTAHEEPTELPQ